MSNSKTLKRAHRSFMASTGVKIGLREFAIHLRSVSAITCYVRADHVAARRWLLEKY